MQYIQKYLFALCNDTNIAKCKIILRNAIDKWKILWYYIFTARGYGLIRKMSVWNAPVYVINCTTQNQEVYYGHEGFQLPCVLGQYQR